MYAIRKIQRVRNNTIVVELPADFPSDQAEVIVLPAQEKVSATGMRSLPEGQASEMYAADIRAFLAQDFSHLPEEEDEVYQRIKQQILHGRRGDEPRILGLFQGLATVPDDFNEPLPEEVESLFWQGTVNGVHADALNDEPAS